MTAELEQIAASQAGAFTVRQAREAGMSRREVDAAREGLWLRLGHGVLVHRAVWDAMDDAARHRCQLSARLLVLRPGWLRRAGLEVVRWGWEEAWRPRGVLDVRIQQALARAEGRDLDPRLWFVSTAQRMASAA